MPVPIPDPDQKWVSMMVEMGSFITPETLVAWAYAAAVELPRLHTNITNVRLDTDPLDERGQRMIPKDVAVRNPFAIDTPGDGRCFLFAASRLIFGYADEARVAELRVRLVIEGFKNKHEYLDHDCLARGMAGPDLMTPIPESLALLSGYYDSDNTMGDIALIFNNMLWNYRRPHEVKLCLTSMQ